MNDAEMNPQINSQVDPRMNSRLNPQVDPQANLQMNPEDFEFGGKLARRLGADLSADEKDDSKKSDEQRREEQMRQAAKVQDWKTHLAEMDYKSRVDATLECLGRKNNQKEILFDLLVFCREERTEPETEKFLEEHKQFYNGYHSAHKYIFFMQRTGALEEREYDSDGTFITDEMRDELRELGASEEDVEDMAVEWRFMTTDVGNEAIKRFSPTDRTREMLATQAVSRIASYRRLLDFCKQPRSLNEITEYMDGDPGLEVDPRTGVMQMQPSAYIGKLDSAGALTWEDGWLTTPGGLEVLETMEIEDKAS